MPQQPPVGRASQIGMPIHECWMPATIVVIMTTNSIPPQCSIRGRAIWKNTPDLGPGAVKPYLLGMTMSEGKVQISLDMDQAMSGRERHRCGRRWSKPVLK